MQDEIEIIDILRILWKWKTFIILGTLVITLAGAGVSLLLPNVYKVSTIIEPGDINKAPIESAESIRENILGEAFDETIRKNLNISLEEYPEIKVTIPKNTSLVQIYTESTDPRRAVNVLNELVALITRRIEKKIEIEKKRIQNEIELARISHGSVLERVALVEGQLADTTAKIQALEHNRQKSIAAKSSDAMSVLLYSNEIQSNQIYLNTLQDKKKDLESQVSSFKIRIDDIRLKLDQIKSTTIIKTPTVPEKPVKPKKLLIAALSFMLGMMGTTLLSFLLEYVRGTRVVEPTREEVAEAGAC